MMVCGVLGPKSNAHGPNEFLHVPYGKKLTAAVAQVEALGLGAGRLPLRGCAPAWVASGLKWAGRRSPVNLLVWPAALHSVTSLEGLGRPWSHLQPALEDFHVRSTLLGGVYIASGNLRGP
jgi:hypothetical protein